MKKIMISASPLIVLLCLWQLASGRIVSASLFPPPTAVAAALGDLILSGTLITDMVASLWRMIVGFFIGTFLGIVIGLLTSQYFWIHRIIAPVIQMLRPLPPVAIVPLIIVWFGIGDGAKIISIAFAVFFPVWIAAHIGGSSIAKQYMWNASLLTTSHRTRFFLVALPAALPMIVAGIQTAISLAFIMIFVSELAGASVGIGYRISISQLDYRIDMMIASLCVLGLLGAGASHLFSFLVRRFLPWMRL